MRRGCLWGEVDQCIAAALLLRRARISDDKIAASLPQRSQIVLSRGPQAIHPAPTLNRLICLAFVPAFSIA